MVVDGHVLVAFVVHSCLCSVSRENDVNDSESDQILRQDKQRLYNRNLGTS